jgi:translation initiation factor IF-1
LISVKRIEDGVVIVCGKPARLQNKRWRILNGDRLLTLRCQ